MCNDHTPDIKQGYGLAWAAGFFDAEGSTYNSTYPALEVSQSDPRTLVIYQEIVNGGKIYGPFYKTTNRKPLWRWKAQSKETKRILDLMWPYLGSLKRQQAQNNIPILNINQERITNLDWASGFFAGDGCLWWDKQRSRIILIIEQTHPESLERFQEACQIGKISGPFLKKHSFKPQTYFWRWRAFDQQQIRELLLNLSLSISMQEYLKDKDMIYVK